MHSNIANKIKNLPQNVRNYCQELQERNQGRHYFVIDDNNARNDPLIPMFVPDRNGFIMNRENQRNLLINDSDFLKTVSYESERESIEVNDCTICLEPFEQDPNTTITYLP